MGSVQGVRRPADGPSVTPSLRDTLLLRERALQATTVSVVITDSRLPDNPVVWVNSAFQDTTGYEPAYAIGRNCRFLQGPDTDPATVAEMRLSVSEERSCSVTILNYRADGSTFWNSVTTAPVHDDDGAVIGFIGMQVDVTDWVKAQEEREEKLRAEQTARLLAEKAQRTLSLLADVNDRLISTFNLSKAMAELVDLLVPRFADGCAVDLVGEAAAGSDMPQRIAAASTEGTDAELGDPSLVGRVLRTGRPVSIYDPADPDAQSLLVVPAIGHEGVLGALTLVSVGQGQGYDEEHLELALEIARRAALAIEWCRLYERERRVASILQRSLLPELPRLPGLDVAAHYRPGDDEHQVGGDWYDLLPLPNGGVGVVVGDVMGHDLNAAAAMGRMRSVLRSYAYELAGPAEVLERLDRMAAGLAMAPITTVWYGVLDPNGTLAYSSAGHLPPLLRHPDGRTEFLSSGRSTLLGVPEPARRPEAVDVLEPGATLLLYTDGLVEERDSDLDAGLEKLRGVVAEAPADAKAAELCSLLLQRSEITGLAAGNDDIAILILQRHPASSVITTS